MFLFLYGHVCARSVPTCCENLTTHSEVTMRPKNVLILKFKFNFLKAHASALTGLSLTEGKVDMTSQK